MLSILLIFHRHNSDVNIILHLIEPSSVWHGIKWDFVNVKYVRIKIDNSLKILLH